MIRLFSCIWVPDNLIEEIEAFLSKLKDTGIKAKFVERENFHVTVNFLGDVNENKLDEIKIKMDNCLSNLREFHVKVEGLKLIPNENYVRVIGVKVNSSDLENLIGCVVKGLGGSFHKKSKLTLCRVKAVPNKVKLREFIKRNCDMRIGEFHVNKISLVKSTLTKSGPVYETIHETELKVK